MKSWKTPTPELVSKAVARLSRDQQYRYFFDHLDNPQWVRPLEAKGYFRNPPAPVRDDLQGTISFPPWPESRYLARMAPLAPEAVLNIALTLETDNVSIQTDLIDAALAMPAEMAEKFANKANRWLNSPYGLLPTKAGKLMEHLAMGGQTNAALKLARGLLTVLPDQAAKDKDANEPTVELPRQPRARFDSWEYGEILKSRVPALVSTAGDRALSLLADLLDLAVDFSQRQDKSTRPMDHSYIWRPAIEDHPQNVSSGIVDMLISAVRDAAEQIAKANPDHVTTIVSILESHQWQVFRRIALHVLGDFPTRASDLIADRLTNREYFDTPGLRHEYYLLSQRCFGMLLAERQAEILGWIDKGPNVELLKMWEAIRPGQQQPAAEDIQTHMRAWQLSRLAPIRSFLSPEWQSRNDALVAELGEPRHPEFLSYSYGAQWGPTSPVRADELRGMTVNEVVSFLDSWQPTPDRMSMFSPTLEGLGRELTSLVTSEPLGFAAAAVQFKGLDPTYVRALLRGLQEAAKQDRVFPWEPVINLCHWVMSQPRGVHEETTYMDRDTGWGWTRKAIAELLGSGFESKSAGIPIDLRMQSWEVLQPLTDDPEPTPEDETRDGGSNMDPATLSINTVRGEAMHSVVRYSLWVRRHLEQQERSKQRESHGLGAMPEVRSVLELHLDPGQDPALAIRAVYGQWFPMLVALDNHWTIENAASVFPDNESLRELRSAAWNTYLAYCEPYDDVFDILQDEYGRAVDRVATQTAEATHLADLSPRLAEHLIVFYLHGRLELDDSQGLLARFYQIAPGTLRAHIASYLGRGLYNAKQGVPPQILDRLRKLWNWRIELVHQATQPSPYFEELSAFGWWFASGQFDADWSMTQLKDVIQLSGRVESDHLVVERLAELADQSPAQSVECLTRIFERDRSGWGAHRWREPARKLLRSVLRSPDAEARQRAESLIHGLGARGHLDYGDLLSDRGA
jgi:hypothetical protein